MTGAIRSLATGTGAGQGERCAKPGTRVLPTLAATGVALTRDRSTPLSRACHGVAGRAGPVFAPLWAPRVTGLLVLVVSVVAMHQLGGGGHRGGVSAMPTMAPTGLVAAAGQPAVQSPPAVAPGPRDAQLVLPVAGTGHALAHPGGMGVMPVCLAVLPALLLLVGEDMCPPTSSRGRAAGCARRLPGGPAEALPLSASTSCA